MKNYQKCHLGQLLDLLARENELVEHTVSPSDLLRTWKELHTNSQHCQAGDIFLAYRGVNRDAHDYVPSLDQRGLSTFIIEEHFRQPLKTPFIRVRNGRAAWSLACAVASGHPEHLMKFYGVTGTNGKSSTIWYLRELLAAQNISCLSLGTLGNFLGDKKIETQHTTPDPPELYALLRESLNQGISTVIMELSSHAVAQSKLVGLNFEALAFTSFSQDHLDFHPDMRSYWNCKWELVAHYCKGRVFLNRSLDRWLKDFGQEPPQGRSLTYGFLGSQSDYEISINNQDTYPPAYEISGPNQSLLADGRAPLDAQFLAENFLAAYLLMSQHPKAKALKQLQGSISNVPGRFQKISIPGEHPALPQVIVDYAHSPDGIFQILKQATTQAKGKVWILFGCGGDRDRSKRPLMAAAAEQGADHIVVTSDNPRFEDPEQIIEDIKKGFALIQPKILVDRAKAIDYVIQNADVHDTIIIAGKGHETYQEMCGQRRHFCDAEQAMLSLNRRLK